MLLTQKYTFCFNTPGTYTDFSKDRCSHCVVYFMSGEAIHLFLVNLVIPQQKPRIIYYYLYELKFILYTYCTCTTCGTKVCHR